MDNYFDNFDKRKCTGCGVCALKCPKKAIIMKIDDEGFLYPVIDKEKCINCGLCKKVCNINIDNKEINSEAYISYTKNNDDKQRSSSGGLFFPLVRYVISENNGVVFGVEMTKDIEAKHSYAETIEDAKKLQGSKYVKSDLNNSYVKVKEFLDKNRWVLFSGTPCQCQGIRKFLGKKYDKLITCEIICHSNPSPKVFKMYIENIEKINNNKIKMISFRSKETGWRNQVPVIEFVDGSKINENSYFKAFTSELLNRPSCHSCSFCTKERYSDFTIGDFWGIENYDSSIKDDDTGISLLCVNTEKGKKILSEIENELFIKKADINDAFEFNHHANKKCHPKREEFFNNIINKKITSDNIIEEMNKYTKKSIIQRLIRKLKRKKHVFVYKISKKR